MSRPDNAVVSPSAVARPSDPVVNRSRAVELHTTLDQPRNSAQRRQRAPVWIAFPLRV
jgi:hypothetical protein